MTNNRFQQKHRKNRLASRIGLHMAGILACSITTFWGLTECYMANAYLAFKHGWFLKSVNSVLLKIRVVIGLPTFWMTHGGNLFDRNYETLVFACVTWGTVIYVVIVLARMGLRQLQARMEKKRPWRVEMNGDRLGE